MLPISSTIEQVKSPALSVATTSEMRNHLSEYLAVLRKGGADAEPFYVGAYRRPEAVLLSIPAYEELLDRLDDVDIAAQVSKRLSDGSSPVEQSVEDLAAQVGIAPDELRSNDS